MQMQEITSGGVMAPAKWAAQFISDMSLHIVNEDYDALEQIKSRSDQIEGIRATLLVNFGEGAKANSYGFSVKDEGTTHAMMFEVLERLTKELAAAQRVAGQARAMAEANTVLRKIAAHVPGRVWIRAKEDAGHGTHIKAQVTDPKVDEAWLEFVAVEPSKEASA